MTGIILTPGNSFRTSSFRTTVFVSSISICWNTKGTVAREYPSGNGGRSQKDDGARSICKLCHIDEIKYFHAYAFPPNFYNNTYNNTFIFNMNAL